ncbi:chaplin family protein [Streptomyces pactum]|uniref:Chaplin domain-containing protein n=1 Tax=Streptomyces pactum TaxID=68249 RepID=A0A1S6J222_9ACTN|nr:chaplin family protein [Streptomyces pactum]AQS65798.1 hypothetical protein B1H29_01550 [Streptomyces pactum]
MHSFARTTLATTAISVAALAATAGSAQAGGIGAGLGPSEGSTCINHGDNRATGAATNATGTATGNLMQVPASRPYNWCGGADLPMM